MDFENRSRVWKMELKQRKQRRRRRRRRRKEGWKKSRRKILDMVAGVTEN